MLYITISPKPEDTQKLDDFFNEIFKDNKLTLFAVRETGKDGNHSHYHIIYNTEQRGCDWKRKYIHTLAKKDVEISKHFMKAKKIVDIKELIYYLLKEIESVVLSNRTTYDIEKLKKKDCIEKLKYRWKLVPSEINFPLVMYQYYENNGYKEKWDHLGGITQKYITEMLYDMEADGICIHHLMGNMENQYKTFKNLIKKAYKYLN